MLNPYSVNIQKRVTRTSKIYFVDTGLLSHLLDIESPEEYVQSQYKGQIFENYVITETMKYYFNVNKSANLYFYRDDNNTEVDLVNLTKDSNYQLCEIKATSLYKQKFSKNLYKVSEYIFNINKCSIIYDGEGSFTDKNVDILDVDTYLTNIQK